MIQSDAEFFKCAVKNYDNPHAVSIDEFKSDIRRIGHLETLINRYVKDKSDLRDRLILNHIVILGNCFSTPISISMMRYKIEKSLHIHLDTFLFFLGWVELVDSLNFELLEILEKTHGRQK